MSGCQPFTGVTGVEDPRTERRRLFFCPALGVGVVCGLAGFEAASGSGTKLKPGLWQGVCGGDREGWAGGGEGL